MFGFLLSTKELRRGIDVDGLVVTTGAVFAAVWAAENWRGHWWVRHWNEVLAAIEASERLIPVFTVSSKESKRWGVLRISVLSSLIPLGFSMG